MSDIITLETQRGLLLNLTEEDCHNYDLLGLDPDDFLVDPMSGPCCVVDPLLISFLVSLKGTWRIEGLCSQGLSISFSDPNEAMRFKLAWSC